MSRFTGRHLGYLICLSTCSLNMMAQGEIFKGNEHLIYEVNYKSDLKEFKDTIRILLTGKKTAVEDQFERILIYQFNNVNYRNLGGNSSFNAQDTSAYADQDNVFFMRPPLHRYYHILELAPIPRIEFPLFPNKNYSHQTYLGRDWGSWSGSKINSTYRVIYNTANTWRLQSEAVVAADKSVINKLFILFNTKEGFLELYYEFADGTTIEFSKL